MCESIFQFLAISVGLFWRKCHFCGFLVDFHSARLYFSYYSQFLQPEIIVNIIGGNYRSIFIFTVFGFIIFGRFWPFLGVFGIFGASVEIWGVLEVLVSYMITRVIKMVVGWVIERVWGFWFLFVGGLGGLGVGGVEST